MGRGGQALTFAFFDTHQCDSEQRAYSASVNVSTIVMLGGSLLHVLCLCGM
jgi:hypothetical protein